MKLQLKPAIIYGCIFQLLLLESCSGIKNCVQCNGKTDEGCDSKTTSDNCKVIQLGGKDSQAKGCRKIHYHPLNDDWYVVRQCAYSGDEWTCEAITGSAGNKNKYTVCECEPDGCNSASHVMPLASVFIAALCAVQILVKAMWRTTLKPRGTQIAAYLKAHNQVLF